MIADEPSRGIAGGARRGAKAGAGMVSPEGREERMRGVLFRGFRIVDCAGGFRGSLLVEGGRIAAVFREGDALPGALAIIDGAGFPEGAALMPAFIDLHAHFREPAFQEEGARMAAETLESASLAAVAGGFATVVCMANAYPPIDEPEKALALKARADALGLVDLRPALALTAGMAGAALSGIARLEPAAPGEGAVLMLSEDGKDVADDGLFLAAMREARRLGLPVSCHCDLGGSEAAAVRRAIRLGASAGCHVHVAHVSTAESVGEIRAAKEGARGGEGFRLTCEAAPHHAGATVADCERMGAAGFGRVNPPLATEADRLAVISGLLDGTIDAIATDHAPHSREGKAAGKPGFSGLETAFSACLANVPPPGGGVSDRLRVLSALMSANPARILALRDRGRIAAGMRADLALVDARAERIVDASRFASRGKCSPFDGARLPGKILMTMRGGRVVHDGGCAQEDWKDGER